MINKIIFFTTKGCEACKIMHRNLVEVINNTPYHIVIEKHCDKPDIAKQYDINDYPTTLFVHDDDIFYRHLGTATVSMINEWCKLKFKN